MTILCGGNLRYLPLSVHCPLTGLGLKGSNFIASPRENEVPLLAFALIMHAVCLFISTQTSRQYPSTELQVNESRANLRIASTALHYTVCYQGTRVPVEVSLDDAPPGHHHTVFFIASFSFVTSTDFLLQSVRPMVTNRIQSERLGTVQSLRLRGWVQSSRSGSYKPSPSP